jgi:voltage-dependent potassium channel beta subunit
MEYRYLGNSGLKVSVLSFGNWLNSNKADDYAITKEAIKLCYEKGVNFFDTAEIYGAGNAETLMGQALQELSYPRESLVISTKIFKCGDGVNNTLLSRKHIIEGLRNSLKRLQMSYVDVVFCHRPDYETPLEETCRAMSWLIDQGLAFYWGTSEWPADRITKAIGLCEKLNLHKPIVEQPQYSMLVRDRFEREYSFLFSEYKMGTTIWSPLAGGILSGKYNEGNVPAGSRYDNHAAMLDSTFQKYFGPVSKEKTCGILQKLNQLANELGYTQAQLALAWCIANKDVSTCILGFTKVSQVEENLKAVDLMKIWTVDIEKRVREILGNEPENIMEFRNWKPMTQRRDCALVTNK